MRSLDGPFEPKVLSDRVCPAMLRWLKLRTLSRQNQEEGGETVPVLRLTVLAMHWFAGVLSFVVVGSTVVLARVALVT